LSQQSASKRTCQLPSYAREVYRKTQVNLGHGTTCGTARGRKLMLLKTLYFSRQLADTPSTIFATPGRSDGKESHSTEMHSHDRDRDVAAAPDCATSAHADHRHPG
jgi:hypothetical protein